MKKIMTRLEINTEHDGKRKTIQNTEYSCSYRRRTLQEKLHEESGHRTQMQDENNIGHSWIGRIHDICSCQRKTGEQFHRKRTRKDTAVEEMRDDISVG
jgi:hypothetical protein